MATENSPPQIRIILTVAFSSVVILGALNYVFKSYFLMMTEEVEHQHLAKPEELIKLHEEEQRNLTTSPLPIQQAMHELASRGRTNYQAFLAHADITPQQSTDTGPLVGWVRNENKAMADKVAAENANPTPPAPVEAISDAGVAPAPAAAGTDAGAALAPRAPGSGSPAAPKRPAPAARDAGAH
jgi:hypothetical protein